MIRKTQDNQIVLEVNLSFYSSEAIAQASYKFTNECYIHMNPISDNVVGVYFKAKQSDISTLEKIVDCFCNELIDQQVRVTVEKNFGSIRDEIVKKAFSSIN